MTASADDARRLWQHFSDPRLWPAERLFFELYSHALLGRPGTEGFLDKAIEPWIDAIAIAALGRDPALGEKKARVEARLAVAVTRGLLLDLLASGDSASVTEAFECYLEHVESSYATAGQADEPG